MERETIIVMVDTLSVLHYEKMVGCAPSKLCRFGLRQRKDRCGSEKKKKKKKEGKFDYVSPVGASGRRTGTAGAKKKEGDAYTVTSTLAWPKPP